MVALNAKTGKLDPGFGNEGELTMDVPFAGVPTIYKNVILVGMNMFGPGEEHLHQQDEVPGGMPGDSRAYDARTGKKLWDFHAIPLPGEVGHDDWKEGNWKARSGNNMWSYAITVDEKRGIVYMPMGGPAANYWGGDRKGNNLFANSVVAVDYQTGKLKWYFQTVHHELWDYDLPPDPVLIDIVKDGKKIPALVQTGKSGYMFILDRVTGKPVFGVEERPVAQGNAPGEWYAATQPFPLKPPPLARVSISRADIVTADDTSADHAKACQELWDKHGFQDAGPFAPWTYQGEGTPQHETISLPGPTGGTNWGGATADPETGYVFVNSQDSPGTGWLRNNPKAKEAGALPVHYASGLLQFQPRPTKMPDGKTLGNLPCIKPPWERLFAVNANTGEIAWQVPLGVTDFLPPEKRNTGRAGAFAGPIATAGGLVFIGATSDARFPRLRFENRQGALDQAARLLRHREPDHVSRQERQTVRCDCFGGSGEGKQSGADCRLRCRRSACSRRYRAVTVRERFPPSALDRTARQPSLSARVQGFHFGALQPRHVGLHLVADVALQVSQVAITFRKTL